MQIFFATLPNGSGQNSAQAFFPSIAFPPALRSLPVSHCSKYVEMEDEKVSSQSNACVHYLATAVVTHPAEKSAPTTSTNSSLVFSTSDGY